MKHDITDEMPLPPQNLHEQYRGINSEGIASEVLMDIGSEEDDEEEEDS
jgi:hypothetical protein